MSGTKAPPEAAEEFLGCTFTYRPPEAVEIFRVYFYGRRRRPKIFSAFLRCTFTRAINSFHCKKIGCCTCSSGLQSTANHGAHECDDHHRAAAWRHDQPHLLTAGASGPYFCYDCYHISSAAAALGLNQPTSTRISIQDG